MLALALLLAAGLAPPPATSPDAHELARWKRHAREVTIVRDDWGIAHVSGRRDADAVFGMEYAQAEDDFDRIEVNYLKALGRMAESDGESALFEDLRMRLFVSPDTLQALYRSSPRWLRGLMDAFADGLNYFLYTHPEVKPRVLTRFEPWMALAFTEGSIGGDIERVSVPALKALYGDAASPLVPESAVPPPLPGGDGPGGGVLGGATDVHLPERGVAPAAVAFGDDPPPLGSGAPSGPTAPAPPQEAGPLPEPGGSNGFAIAPRLTRRGHALLWINPHTSFYFRSELQMTSREGLDVYGAVTWGQFFVYQGFNRTAGWIHSSSGVDNIDEYLETVSERGGVLSTRHGADEEPVRSRTVTLRVRTPSGMTERRFIVHATRHGPVVRMAGDRWVTVTLMQKPVEALAQSFVRTKARDFAAFRRQMERHANSSNNTVFADAKGTVAYMHSNWIPRRNDQFDWRKPVDGSDPATDPHGVMSFDETPNVVNPASGWVFNVNNWPWTAAGAGSLPRDAYPRYVETGQEESPRGEHALRLLADGRDWTLESLAEAAFDPWLPSFTRLLPRLLAAYDALPGTDPERARFAEPVETLRAWDRRWGAESVPTTLAVHWGEAMLRAVRDSALAADVSSQAYVATRSPDGVLLSGLAAALDTLTSRYGGWRVPWGDVNRFQRLDGAIVARFDDAQPSTPVPFTSGLWGSLASFGAVSPGGVKRRYGVSGNSFVAGVEFGDTLRAIAVTAGGESGHPDSPHFADQVERYASGRLREVYFHPWQLQGHVERRYHPGE